MCLSSVLCQKIPNCSMNPYLHRVFQRKALGEFANSRPQMHLLALYAAYNAGMDKKLVSYSLTVRSSAYAESLERN